MQEAQLRVKLFIITMLLFWSAMSFALETRDNGLWPALAQSAQTLSESAQKLEALDQEFLRQKAHHLYFNSVYILVTKGIEKKIKKNWFERPQCVQKMVQSFCQLYWDALLSFYYHIGEQTPGTWALTFMTNEGKKEGATTELMMAMNSHILRDLPVALVQVAKDDDECSLDRVKKDYFKLNIFFDSSILELNANLRRNIDRLSTKDNWKLLRPAKLFVMKKVVARMRQMAWNKALYLNNAKSLEDYNYRLSLIDERAYETALYVLQGGVFLPNDGL